jgi:hypothetical protein
VVAGTPGSVIVPAGGVTSVIGAWGRRPVAAAAVRLSSAVVPPETLAAFLVSTATTGPITPVVRGGTVAFDIPAAARGDGYVPVTIANPSADLSLAVQVQVDVR